MSRVLPIAIAIFSLVPSVAQAEPVAGVSSEQESFSIAYGSGVRLGTDDSPFQLKAKGRLQTRFTADRFSDDATSERESELEIKRARITLSGNLGTPVVTYKFQLDFTEAKLIFKDYYADVAVAPAADVHLRVGYAKRPFSRQQIASSGSLSFVDRSITDKPFGAGRDFGLTLHNQVDKSPEFEWAVGLYNRTGLDSGDDPTIVGPVVVGRVGYNQGGIDAYSEPDLKGGPLRFGTAASVHVEFDSDDDRASAWRAQADYIVKAHGWSTSGAVFASSIQDGMRVTNRAFEAVGAYAQLGYTVSGRLQPSVRYAVIAAADGAEMVADQQEISGGFSIYLMGHKLKWQTDVSALQEQGKPSDLRARSQIQMIF